MPKAKKERVDTHQTVRADINPQLCKTYNELKHDWSKTWIVEPKFDGIRCWVVVDEDGKANAYSRNGKPLWNMELILEEVEDAGFRDYVLDGEVFATDWALSMGIVKSQTPHADRSQLKFHVWDCLHGSEMRSNWSDATHRIHGGCSSVSNHDRKEQRLWPWVTLDLPRVLIVPTRWVTSPEELRVSYVEFLEQGYEGAILKDPAGPYQGGRRSPYWLKIKPWTDADLTVVGSCPGEGKHVGRIGALVLEGQAEWNGKTYTINTEVGTGFTDDEREHFQQLFDNGQLVGKVIEIKFQDITVEGACRFPVFNRLREDR